MLRLQATVGLIRGLRRRSSLRPRFRAGLRLASSAARSASSATNFRLPSDIASSGSPVLTASDLRRVLSGRLRRRPTSGLHRNSRPSTPPSEPPPACAGCCSFGFVGGQLSDFHRTLNSPAPPSLQPPACAGFCLFDGVGGSSSDFPLDIS